MKIQSAALFKDEIKPKCAQISLLTGAVSLLKGMRLIMRPGLRRYLIVPLMINILIFSGLIWFGLSQFDQLFDRFLPETSWLHYFRWLLWPLLTLTILLVLFYTFTVVANLLAAPFNGILSAKVEQMLTGSPPPDAPGNWVAEIVPGVRSELRKLFYFLIRAIPLLLLFLIPGVQLAAPFLWIAFSTWFLALEYLDYPLSNHDVQFRDQLQWMKKSRMGAIGFGGAVAFSMLIPIVNLAVMPAAVAGATIIWCRCRSPEEIAEKNTPVQ